MAKKKVFVTDEPCSISQPVFSAGWLFEFYIIENSQIIETIAIECDGTTEEEATNNAVKQLEGLEWLYTGKFKKLG